jgi:REP element-mobilizing transposase RayT
MDAPDALHHVISRGIERSKIFCDDVDREDFLRRLGKLVQQTETKCYAWALIPSHFHLLLKTGKVPISTIMLRLLTGYAAGYNRRHRRRGHLFQNRYKSILCQEDTYFAELVRYIHLNPLRAGLVKDLDTLGKYPYTGHSVLMGIQNNDWQSTESVFAIFGNKHAQARRKYLDYVAEGAKQGRRPELIGGGLMRNAGGWAGVQMLRKSEVFQKSDERILGDSDFVDRVLAESEEKLACQYAMQAKGINLDHLRRVVTALMNIIPEDLVGPSKNRKVTRARIFFAIGRFGIWVFQ